MRALLHAYDVRKESEMSRPADFNDRTTLKPVAKIFKVEITNVIRLTEMEKLFHLRIIDRADRERFTFQPGQFIMIEVPGYGEVPISISSSTSNKGFLEVCIRKVGTVTNALHRAQRGAKVGIRGPFGTYFPLQRMVGQSILLIAGGLGLAPLRAPIYYVTENRADFKDVHILYGTKSQNLLLFDYQYESWRRIDDVNMQIIVEEPDATWDGPVGMITDLLDDVRLESSETYAIVCGPPVMFKFVCQRLNQMGIPMDRMFVSLERRMQCGVGKCCRCNVGATYTCTDGPVFDYWSVINLKEAI
jgi:NAD(P)H-flavin reductase